jgi:hypothetical protein
LRTTSIKRLAAIAAASAVAATVIPLAVAGPAHAKSCKWTVISYDPATHTSVVACVGANRP